ncbi:MAG: NUDIX hydrolase [Parcubacteria group bacterium]|nr:NUDIX hydrolase [Parcubacteria group bacterium]
MPHGGESFKATVLEKRPICFVGDASGLEPFFKLEHWRVNCDGREDDRVVWTRGDFVLVVAITPKNEVVLIREYKQAIEQIVLCVPAGGREKGEDIGAAGLRELKEESGYTSHTGRCHVFGPFFNSPDKSTERHYVLVVTDAEIQGAPAPEESETILGVQLCGLKDAKKKIVVGMHRLAVDVAIEFLADRGA